MKRSVSEHIYKALTSSDAIVEKVGMNIYPIATKSEVKFPFIVYERENVVTRYDKSGPSSADIDESIYVLSESYSESEEIAQLVIDRLERQNAKYEDFEVIGAVVNDVPENYISQTYVQQIRMRFTIK